MYNYFPPCSDTSLLALPSEALIVVPHLAALHHPRSHAAPHLVRHLLWSADNDGDGALRAEPKCLVDNLCKVGPAAVLLRLARARASARRAPARCRQRPHFHCRAAFAVASVRVSRGGGDRVATGQEELDALVAQHGLAAAAARGAGGHGPGRVAGGANRPDHLQPGERHLGLRGVEDGQDKGRADTAGDEEDAAGAAGEQRAVLARHGAIRPLDAETHLGIVGGCRRRDRGGVVDEDAAHGAAPRAHDEADGVGVFDERRDRVWVIRVVKQGRLRSRNRVLATFGRQAEVDVRARRGAKGIQVARRKRRRDPDEGRAGDGLDRGLRHAGVALAHGEVEQENEAALDDVPPQRLGVEDEQRGREKGANQVGDEEDAVGGIANLFHGRNGDGVEEQRGQDATEDGGCEESAYPLARRDEVHII